MQRVSAIEAVSFIRSNDTIVIGGSGGGHAVPEALMAALERRFLSEGLPRNITAIHPVGLGDGATRWAPIISPMKGLLKRIVCGTFVNLAKNLRHGDWPTRSKATLCRRARCRN